MFDEVLLYFTAPSMDSASSFALSVPTRCAKSTRSTWSILEDLANSLALFLALETVWYSLDVIMLLASWENAESFFGMVLESSARSTTERVVACPRHF